MLNFSSIFLVAALLLHQHETEGARILAVFQFNGYSHFIMFEALLKGLAARGHDVVVVSHFPQKHPVSNYTDISVNGSLGPAVNAFTAEFAINFRYHKAMKFFWVDNLEFCSAVFDHPNVQKLIRSKEHFDLVITEIFGVDCMVGFAHHFRAPLVSMCSSMALPWAVDRIGNPDNPAYIPNYFLPATDRMSLWQRIENTVFNVVLKLGSYYFSELPNEQLSRKHFGPHLPPIRDIVRNTSLILVNSHFSLTFPRPTVPSFVEVGGLHIQTPGKLPQHLQKFLDGAGEAGAIYFSLGSLVRGETLPEDKLKAFLSAFSELPQRVLWKTDTVPGTPDNVMTSAWMPQLEILNHPNVKLFITHGGLMGTQESVYMGIPMVGIPLFSDQKLNIENYVSKGVAVKIDYHSITKETVLAAVRRVLHNPSFRENMQRLSKQFRDRPQSALETAIFWTEYVIRHRGTPHMKSAAVDMYWYQYLLLDVIAVLLIGFSIVFYTTYFILKKLALLSYLIAQSLEDPFQKHKKQ